MNKKSDSLRIGCFAVLAALAAAGSAIAGDAKSGKPVMTVFNWSEYIDPQVYRQFEGAFNCVVKEVTFETPEEALNKMIAGGSRTFDVCAVGGSSMIPPAVAQGVLRELDHAKIPNLANLSPEFRDPDYDRGNRFSIPYQWGTTGVFMRKDLVPAGGFSLASFFDEKRELGRFALLDSVRETLGYANICQGRELNSVDSDVLQRSIAMLVRARDSRNFMGFEGGIGGRSKVVAGVADYAIVYSGDAIRALEQYPGRFAYVLPVEGAVGWSDQLCIAKDAPHAELAYAFLNYVLDARIGAQISTWTKFATPNEAARKYLKPGDLANPAIYPSAAEMRKLQFIEDLGEKETIRNDAWTAIKSG